MESVRAATVRADTDVVALRVRGDVLLSLIAEFPDIGLAIMREQFKRFASSQEQLVQLVRGMETPKAAE